MKKDIWVLCSVREDVIEVQRRINSRGGMRAFCMLSIGTLQKSVDRIALTGEYPSLLIADYETGKAEEFQSLRLLMSQSAFVGIPLFFMASVKEDAVDAECYELGATVVLRKPFSDMDVQRIERAAWQHEMTRSYEKVLQKQALEISAAKEIQRLNEKLATRNELLHRILGKYFSDDVVDVILEQPTEEWIGGEKRTVAVMMADLRGFTALSERLSAEVMVAILNHYLEEMTDVIMKYKGTIIEFVGDAILAVFGAPLKTERAVQDAVAAAIEMQNRMKGVNRFNDEKGYPHIEMGIGLHSGEVFIGNIGSERFMRYNVIGQVVNLCSRIQNYSVGGQVLASETLVQTCKEQLCVADTFEIAVKGIHEEIRICNLRGISGTDFVALEDSILEDMVILTTPAKVSVYFLQGKTMIKEFKQGEIRSVSRHEICLEGKKEWLQEVALYQDIELLLGGENAYAKVMAKEGDILRLRITFLSEKFYEICVDDKKEGTK